MARKDEEGNKRKGSDKAKERYQKNGKFSSKHIRMSEALKDHVYNKVQNRRKK